MSKYDAILKYQEIDLRVRKHEMNIERSEDYKRAKAAQDVFQAAKKTSEECEKKAEEAVAHFAKLQSFLADIERKTEELDSEKPSAENYGVLKDSVDKVYKSLSKVEGDLDIINKRITDVGKNYDDSLKKGKTARTAFNDAKAKYMDLKTAEDAEIDKLRAELDKIAQSVEPALYERYRALRKDKVLPAVICVDTKQSGLTCTGCMMELSVNAKSRLTSVGMIECENCRRLIISSNT
ncbi:MAG: hypothetical protein FWE62_03625 [Firmicutes bacterium]|nr:hypothetical protein [Bacillota bacterium]